MSTIAGDGNNNTLAGSNSDDLISGLDGNDSISGLQGDDTLDGGNNNDTLVGGQGADSLIGGADNDSLSGGSENDVLNGGDGADTLVGGTGADAMIGGAGDDTYNVDDPGDSVNENAGEGTDTVKTTLSDYTLSANVENLNYLGSAAFVGTGNALANAIIGGAANDTLDGGAGADTLTGGNGDDTYIVDNSADAIVEGSAASSGIDTVRATASSYTLGANVENLTFAGSGGFAGTGNASNNQIAGGSGDDTLNGGAGNDTLIGSDGNDSLTGGSGNNSLDGGTGTDTASYASSSASVNVDLSTGLASNGVGGSDTLSGIENVTGSAFADTFIGGSGTEVLSGGAGNDVFVFTMAGFSNADTILGGADSDTLKFTTAGTLTSGAFANVSGIGLIQLADGINNITVGDTSITNSENQTLTIDASISSGTTTINAGNAGLGHKVALKGGGSNDTLTGGAGDDTLVGNDGNDSLIANGGNNSIDGGAGIDTVSYASSNAGVNVDLSAGTASNGFGGTDTLFGIENIIGSGFADTIVAGSGDNSIVGGAGHDLFLFSIDALNSADSVLGGSDGDILRFTTAGTIAATALAGVKGIGAIQLADGANAITVSDGLVGNSENQHLTIDGSSSNGNAVITASAAIAGHSVVLIGGGGNDTLTGGAGDDTLIAGAGDDSLAGGGGNDFFQFAADNLNSSDIILGGAGSDTLQFITAGTIAAASLSGISGIGTIVLADGANAITLSNGVVSASENQQLTIDASASSGPTTIDGSAVAAGHSLNLEGGSGDDIFLGSGGNDTLDGGAGIDTASYVDATAGVTVGLAVVGPQAIGGGQGFDSLISIENIIGSSADDTLGGSAADNSIDGGDGDDSITGGDGNDTVSGAGNNDTIAGGLGSDLLSGGDRNDVLIGGVGDDTLDGGAGTDTASFESDTIGVLADLSAGTASGSASGNDSLIAIENLAGGSGADTLIGGVTGNNLAGNGGDDSLDGGAGSDTLIGGAGSDTLNGGADVDTVAFDGDTMGVHADLVLGTAFGAASGNDILIAIENLTGGGGADTLAGDINTNVLSGAGGNDSLDGGDGDDTLNGGAGNDVLAGGQGSDTVTFSGDSIGVRANLLNGTASCSASGNDTLTGIENLTGGSGDDTLVGDTNSNILSGSGGDDSLDGGSGNDFLTGGSGNDTLNGGDGSDTVQYLLDTKGVNASLLAETANGSATGNDALIGIENLAGGFGADTLTGDGNANAFTGNGGNDSIDGGGGTDLAIYTGLLSDYAISLSGSIVTIADTRVGTPDGADSVTGVANFQFADGTFALAEIIGGNLTAVPDNAAAVEAGGTNNATAGINPAGNVLDNDMSSRSGDTLLVQGVAAGISSNPLLGGVGATIGGAYGSLQLNADGTYTYTVDNSNSTVEALNSGVSLSDVFSYTMNASSAATSTTTLTVTINGADDAPTTPVDGNASANSVLEGAANGTIAGITASSTDSDSGPLQYFLLDDADGRFAIDTVTGVVTVANGARIDYETATGHTIVVQVSDGTLSTSQSFQIDVIDVPGVAIAGSSKADVVDAAHTVAGQPIPTGENDTILGNNGNDSLAGLGGNDWLDGGSGKDTMLGGLGDDTYVVDNAGDVVSENANEGVDSVHTKLASYVLGADIENLAYTGTGKFAATGNALDNVISGGVGNDTLDGGTGADTLSGGAANDTYVVDSTGDVVVEEAGGGMDTVKTALTSYALSANVENLTFTGAGNFSGIGNELGNVIVGSNGNDTLDGGTGADTLTGGLGNDVYIVDGAADSIVEKSGGGTDTVRTSLSGYTLGSQLENVVYTGAGHFAGTGNGLANSIIGGSGSDTLNGAGGNDSIDGGAGADSLIGGSGNDIFVFSAGEANGDIVSDFKPGQDHLQFVGFGAGSTFTQVTGTDWTITDGVDHHSETIHLTNAPAMHPADYMFE